MPSGHYSIVPDDLFVTEFQTLGATAFASKYSITLRKVHERRRKVEAKFGIVIQAPNTYVGAAASAEIYRQEAFPGRLNMSVENGIVLIGGDAHFWPGRIPLMHRAFLAFIKEFRSDRILRTVIMNGDVMDFPQISRWPQVDWARVPTVKDEIENAVVRMHEIEEACGQVEKIWPLGNHDARFSMHIAAKAPELVGVKGVHLKDHFPRWKPCWRIDINDGINTVIVKHTFKGGENAPKNNVDASAAHFVTNHLHSAHVRPRTKHFGDLYGVDTGCLADTYGPQFLYAQDNPRDWRSAFAVLTFHKGKLLMPELVLAVDDKHIQFRGEVKRV
jgi:hypothetical protein